MSATAHKPQTLEEALRSISPAFGKELPDAHIDALLAHGFEGHDVNKVRDAVASIVVHGNLSEPDAVAAQTLSKMESIARAQSAPHGAAHTTSGATSADNVDRTFTQRRAGQIDEATEAALKGARRTAHNERIINEMGQGEQFMQRLENHPLSTAMGLIMAGMMAFGALDSAQHVFDKDDSGKTKVNMTPLMWTLGSAALAAGTAYLTLKPQYITTLVR